MHASVHDATSGRKVAQIRRIEIPYDRSIGSIDVTTLTRYLHQLAMSDSAADRARFTDYYEAPKAPWDIGRPQQPFVEASERIVAAGQGGPARVLDIGCGTGDLAIHLARQGCRVTGIDFLEGPISLARAKARDGGISATFLVMDALAVGEIPERFDAVTDCGLFHVFDDVRRAAYVSALAKLLEPGARVFILCFSDQEPGEHGPRRVSDREIRDAFRDGWVVESVEPARFEVVPGIPHAIFSEGGAKAHFATIRRV
jgi:SAM-dependent methyltransferase